MRLPQSRETIMSKNTPITCARLTLPIATAKEFQRRFGRILSENDRQRIRKLLRAGGLADAIAEVERLTSETESPEP